MPLARPLVPQPAPDANIFSTQQEAALGDAMDTGIRLTMHVVQDPAILQPLHAIATRLEAQMPPDPPQIRVVLFDSSSADAFSIPGHIYIARKLVALTRSEDEMAGILAHEMGHILAHHSAITASDNLRRVLKVTQVGDDADVVAKWNDYLNNYKRVKFTGSDVERVEKAERQHQEQADNIGLSLVAKAGYSTHAFVDVFDRVAETQGKTGNAWTDIFGNTTPDSKRLRQIAKERPPLPADCVMAHGDTIPNYTAWRAKVIEHSTEAASVKVSGLISQRLLTERLRPQIGYIRISPDGRYVLAQDDSNIFVLTRSPLKNLFRFDAPDANTAHFTPDSNGIVFQTAGMGTSPRVEHWDIASHKRLDAFEIYVRRGCVLSNLSPDGRTLSCLTFNSVENSVNFDFDLFDTASGKSFFHKKDWIFVNSLHFDYSTLFRISLGLASGNQAIYDELSHVTFSPDGHYLVARSHDSTLAMDLTTRSAINLPSGVKDLLGFGRFTFLADGHFIGVVGNGNNAKVVEFPSGRMIYPDILVGAAHLTPVARGDYTRLTPVKDNPLGVVDLKQNKIFFQSKRTAFDMWDMQGIGERENGDLITLDLTTAKIQESVALPEARLGGIRAAAVSADLKWLAISQASRGAVWNVETGQRVYHVRGFQGAYFKPGSD
ncbi:MAG TPA: M48 family metalloprotease, partial [Candidatus Angelobacter sp.]|nr:M48 family metalloprotease [Candidatus Angelobacter sp.]